MIVGATKKAPTSTKIRLAVEWGKATPRTGCINMPSEKSLLRGNCGGNPLHLTTNNCNGLHSATSRSAVNVVQNLGRERHYSPAQEIK